MDLTNVINVVVQNWFLTCFAATVLYFMIKFGNIYIEKHVQGAHFKLNNDLVMNLVRSVVWYHSRGKIRTIEQILIENNIESRKEEITKKIRNCLEERTQIYIDYFNTLNTNIERIGDEYARLFEMESFFDELISIALRPYKSSNHDMEIMIKLKDISEVMTFWQEKANKKLDDELKRIANIIK